MDFSRHDRRHRSCACSDRRGSWPGSGAHCCAQACAVPSPRQVSRAFQAETGQTPAKAVENLRLEGARALMEDTNHTLDVVAQLTGFGDRNQMRRAFLRAYGQPPQVIRRQSRGGYASIMESELAEP